jgi:uncharacterized repeat protein (TIGR03803 family)
MLSHAHSTQYAKRAELTLLLTVAVAALGILAAIPARAQTETVLYSFTYSPSALGGFGCPPLPLSGSPNEQPHEGLLFYNGALYGTTPEGGAGIKKDPDSDDGMVFRLTKPKSGGTSWNEQTLHSFTPYDDGSYPCSRLIERNDAPPYTGYSLIGTTVGGLNGYGTIFALTPPATGQTGWTENILYTFKGESDGREPFDGLTIGSDGSLYGVARLGTDGIAYPSVFQLTPDGTLVTLAVNYDGVVFNGDLLLDSATGLLFGTTQNGGAYGYGDVFELIPSVAPPNNIIDLYDFTGGSDGASPNGGLKGGTGDLFGTTQGGGDGTGSDGGGVLFELRQEIAGNPYTLIVQHTFSGGVAADGAVPGAGLYKDSTGTLWGTTEYGGVFRRNFATYGTIFKLYPDPVVVHEWHYAVAYDFAGEPDGAYPQSLLTEDKKGNLYGTTNAGGSANEGTVFQFTP